MKKFFAFCLLSFCFFTTVHAQVIYNKMALHLVKGKTYYYITTSKTNVTQTIKEKDNIRGTELNSRLAFTVTGIRDSLYDMDVRYEVLSLKMGSASDIAVYNSFSKDPSDVASVMFNLLTKETFKAVITKSGNLQSITGISKTLDRLFNQASNIPVDQKAQVKSLMLQTIGENAFRSNYEMVAPILPSIAVKKGVIWTSDTQLSGSGTADVHTAYELKDIEDTFYHIRSSSNIRYPDKDVFKTVNGMEVRNELDGIMSADIVIDKFTGWIKQVTVYQSISGNTYIKDNPKVPGGVVMPMKMRADITVTDVH